MSRERIIVAIDGYSSCGKSTFAKAIAARMGYTFIDTGAMYRAVTYVALRSGAIADGVVDSERVVDIANNTHLAFDSQSGVSVITIDGEYVGNELRTMEVNSHVSAVSAIEGVRISLVAAQQAMGRKGGVVMDGRDIGSVVFPDAEVKIFMTADPVIRGERRYKELLQKGIEANLDDVIDNVISRDRADETRKISPLTRAEDAIVLDNSTMSLEQQMEWFERIYENLFKFFLT